MSENKLRIAMLSTHSCPVGTLGARDTGGMSVYIVELARALARRGHTVDVYTRVHDPADPIIVELGENARLIHLRAGEIEQVHKLAVYSYLPDFSCNLEAYRKEHDLHYDIVFSHYWLSTWVGQYLEKWWHVPHMTMFHTLGAVKNSIGLGESEPDLRLEWEAQLAKNVPRIIAPTEREKAAMVVHYGAAGEKISVIPCGVNLELFRPQDKETARRELGLEEGPVILSIGRIEPLKGLEQLMKAMPRLRGGHGARLVVIGGDPNSQGEVEKLQSLAGEMGIGEAVRFTGSVKQDVLPLYYSAADVSVISSYYESFGLVALESLACGTPVVATDVGNLREIIRQGESGYVVESNAPEELAEKIDLLLSRPEAEKASQASIRASVTDYDWSNIAGAVADEFRRVLDDYCAAV